VVAAGGEQIFRRLPTAIGGQDLDPIWHRRQIGLPYDQGR
jgi:hypothetical protein